MIQDTLNSFRDNLIQKTRNPLLGTFIIVWIIRNWKFVYSILFFDKEFKLDNRIEKIESFFKNYDYEEIFTTLFVTFIILISTYILLNLSRLIVNFFEKIVTPKIYKITDKSSIVLKEDFIKVQNEVENLELKIRQEKEKRLKTQNENEILEKRILELMVPKTEDINESNDSREKTKIDDGKIQLLIKKLTKEKKVDEFNKVASNILSDYPFEKSNEDVRTFIELGLIKPGNHAGSNRYMFAFTKNGQDVHEQLLMEKLK
jgi:hypothetical protein